MYKRAKQKVVAFLDGGRLRGKVKLEELTRGIYFRSERCFGTVNGPVPEG